MRRRLRRRPAPRKALTPKTAIGKALGSDDSGALRVALLPCGMHGSAWKGGYRPRSYRTGWVGMLYPSSAPAGAPAAPGRSALPCFAAESARMGTLMSLPEGIATLGCPRYATWCVHGGAVSSERDIRVPEAKRGRVPCRNEDERRPSRIRPLPFPDPKSVIRRY